MPFISSSPRSKHSGIKHGTGCGENCSSVSYEFSCDKSTDGHHVADVPALNPANSTSFENRLVEADHGLVILSQLPTFNPTQLALNTERADLAVLIDRHYRAFQSPLNPNWTWKKATIEVITLRKAFPAISEVGDTLLAMTAWFHFLCNIDDEIERMDSLGRALVIDLIIGALQALSLDRLQPREQIKAARGVLHIFKKINISLHRKVPLNMRERMVTGRYSAAVAAIADQQQTVFDDSAESSHANVLALASSFIRQCQEVLSPQALPKVFAEVINYLGALKKESAYRESTALSSIEEYMRLRMGTIGISPFFVILANTLVSVEVQKVKKPNTGCKNDTKGLGGNGSIIYNSSGSSSFWISPLHTRLCDSTQRIVGLQNDIVGLNRDIENGDRLNLAVLLLEHQNETTENTQAVNEARITAVNMHNTEMENMMQTWADIKAAKYSPAVQIYTHSLVAFTRTFYTWATHTDRYRAKHTDFSEFFSNTAKNTAMEGLRFKAKVIRTRSSLQKLVVSHTK